jgi:diguanylate cyclase (GGDEF)-like protein
MSAIASANHSVSDSAGYDRGWANLLLGRDLVCRRATRHWLLSALSYLVSLISLCIAVRSDLTSARDAWLFTAYCAIGMSGFYVAIRSGWSARFSDPTLTFPMALFTSSAIMLSYSLSEITRGASLQLLFVLVIFDLQRLNQRQTIALTSGATLMLAGILGYMAFKHDEGFDLSNEIFSIGMGALMLPMLSMVAREVRRLRRIQAQQRADLETTLTQLNELSIRDTLTGAFNRRQMLSMLDEEAKRRPRTDVGFCVAILDLDLFKHINDTYGHPTGDAVLRNVTTLMLQQLRSTDALGRWGGEEFVLLLRDSDCHAAMHLIDRLRQLINNHEWQIVAAGLNVSFSAGVCEHHTDADLNHTLERADRALYVAKAEGRNKVVAATMSA